MKASSHTTAWALAIAAALLLTNCSSEGRVIDSHQYQLGGHTFVQKRILLCENPRETRVISYQVQ